MLKHVAELQILQKQHARPMAFSHGKILCWILCQINGVQRICSVFPRK